MTAKEAILPKKTRELQTLHLDSTIWNEFKFRDGDIIISTYGKSGTTWMQQIIAQMLFAGDTEMDTQAMSPWVDYVIPPKEVKLAALEAQTHRRFVKTHLPVDAVVYSPKAKYIYIGRDGRDVLWSFYNHHSSGTQAMYNGLNKQAGPGWPSAGASASTFANTGTPGSKGKDTRIGRSGGVSVFLVGNPPSAEYSDGAFTTFCEE